MSYEVVIVDVGDADAIVINYSDGFLWKTAVVDAGNVGDGAKVKKYIKHVEYGKIIIDHAFCTHPDRDHKGGFFDILNDNEITVRFFYIRRPDVAVRNDARRMIYPIGQLEACAKAVYNHPSDPSLNLINLAISKSCLLEPRLNCDVLGMPLRMIGPRDDYFHEACLKMAFDFAELEEEEQPETYAEDELPTDEFAKSVMDEEKENSATNMSSLILLFHPGERSFLLAGDACSASIHDAIVDYPHELVGCTLKVPHHGSKHNLTTEVIDLIRPQSAVISCRGTRKHPNPAIVHYLSKYCNVYSTHKSRTLVYSDAPVRAPAIALRKKQR